MLMKKLCLLFLIPLLFVSCGDTTGDTAGTELGTGIGGDEDTTSGGSPIKPSTPGNYIISSPNTEVNGVSNSGSIKIIDGVTGEQIGETISGETNNDQLGSSGVTTLANGNIVIASQYHDVEGVTNAGSVMIINGATGRQIGSTIAGGSTGDQIGSSGITTLGNGNFIISSGLDNVEGVTDAGSVRVINGTTGEQVGPLLFGDEAGDSLGSSGITVLSNGNFVIATENDNVNGVQNSGSVRIINGATGIQVGSTLSGNNSNDKLGSSSITAIRNGNFVIASSNDDVGGVTDDDVGSVTDAGSVRIINGATGAQIGSTLSGNCLNDQFGNASITALDNGRFVIASQYDDIGTITNAGSVRIVNGNNGEQVTATFAGDTVGDQLGSSSITNLGNGNFVIASELDNVNGVTNAGSIIIVNGNTGEQVGTTLSGNNSNDLLGSSSITVLPNGNFVVASEDDDVDGVTNAGSVKIINGLTGEQIGSTISGDDENDRLGNSSVTALDSGNFVIATSGDDIGGITNAGSVRIINATTGAQIGATISGNNSSDQLGSSGITALSDGNFIISSEMDDVGGIRNAGSIRVINGGTGEQIGDTVSGENIDDRVGSSPIVKF